MEGEKEEEEGKGEVVRNEVLGRWSFVFSLFFYFYFFVDCEGKKEVEGKLTVCSGQTASAQGGSSHQVSVGGKVQNTYSREGESDWATHRDERRKGRGSRLGGRAKVGPEKERAVKGKGRAVKKNLEAKRERVSRVSPRKKWIPRTAEQRGSVRRSRK
jgi:hypothetical protein